MAIISTILIMIATNISYNYGYNYGYNKGKQQQEIVYEKVYVHDTIQVEQKLMNLLITYSEYVDAAEAIIQMYYDYDNAYYLDSISETLEYKDYINACDKLNKCN